MMFEKDYDNLVKSLFLLADRKIIAILYTIYDNRENSCRRKKFPATYV